MPDPQFLNPQVLSKMNTRAVYQVTLSQWRVGDDGGYFGTIFLEDKKKEKGEMWRKGGGDAGSEMWSACLQKELEVV